MPNEPVPEVPIPSFISRRVVQGRYLFLDLDPPATTDLAVACAGWESCAPGYEIERNDFRYMALEYIVGGIWELGTPAGKWEVGTGTIFTYGPGVSYSLKALSRTGLSKCFVDFTGRTAGRLLARCGLEGGRPGRAIHGRWLPDLFEQTIETEHLRPRARKSISNMLVVLLMEGVREDLRAEEHFPPCTT